MHPSYNDISNRFTSLTDLEVHGRSMYQLGCLSTFAVCLEQHKSCVLFAHNTLFFPTLKRPKWPRIRVTSYRFARKSLKYVDNVAPDQPAHPRRLIQKPHCRLRCAVRSKSFTVRLSVEWVAIDLLADSVALRSDCMNVQGWYGATLFAYDMWQMSLVAGKQLKNAQGEQSANKVLGWQ